MDHYEILGVRRGAGAGEITAAFRALAKVHHPDHGGDGERFSRLVLARTAALADAQNTPSSRVPQRATAPATTSRTPHAQHDSVTVFRVGPSPFTPPPARIPFFKI